VGDGDSPQNDQPAHVFDERGAARYTGVSQATLRLWRTKDEGPPYFKAGQKLVRYRRSDLDLWIESRIEKPADSGMSSAALGEQRRPR
jgi:predicted DNA-binding transcriptional regulator AlpA